MGKKVTISSAKVAQALMRPGKHNAGDNLYLVIDQRLTKAGTALYRYWYLIYSSKGRRREMGLGSANLLSLAEARQKALEARKLLGDGIDPLDARLAQRKAAVPIPTFGEFADAYVKDHKAKFRNGKHVAQWEMTMGNAYCKAIRSRPISEVDTDQVLKVLQPIWSKVPETASRIRGRLENVFDAAKVRGLYRGENPARWRGHLQAILPARQRLTRGHHAALPYNELPVFMAAVQLSLSTTARALEFCILTASRSGETLGAQWDEIDMEHGIWTIPASRMKAGHQHRVPLGSRARAILVELQQSRSSQFVFVGTKPEKALSSMAMTMLLRRLGKNDITVHGFRSTFRDWASEQTAFPHETCEHALAHRISDKAEAAYRRGDQFEKRKALMQAWEKFSNPSFDVSKSEELSP